MPPPSNIWGRVECYFEPAFLLMSAIYYFMIVALEFAIKRHNPFTLLSHLSEVRDEAFSRFWIQFSKATEAQDQGLATSELEGSAALIPALLAEASGVVLDIGPGSGSHLPELAKHAKQMTRIYGAEPCVGLHDTLRKKITAADLETKYTILDCSAELGSLMPALKKTGNIPESAHPREIFDTIICFRVLCGIPEAQSAVHDFYRLLKPGGKLIVCEHVVNPWRSAKGSVVARMFQSFYQLCGWSFFVGNCSLVRDTRDVLVKAASQDGGWGDVVLEDNFGWAPLPYLSGILVKRR